MKQLRNNNIKHNRNLTCFVFLLIYFLVVIYFFYVYVHCFWKMTYDNKIITIAKC